MIEYEQLNEAQKQAVNILDKSHIAIIFGGPGKGKTTVLQHIIKRLNERCLSYVLAAPTGKAAKKMQEATGIQAKTIHKMIEPYMKNKRFEFQRNEENPIEEQVIIIDECSMVDNWLMKSVMSAINPEHYLLIIGDDGQLQSVGPGAVLRDFIQSDIIPKIELTEIYRNSGDIAYACHDIKSGNIYNPSPIIDIDKGLNNRHLECSNESGIISIIDKCYEKFTGMGYNPIWDIQVLSPVNDRGVLSCKGLNEHLQNRLNDNPAYTEHENIIFRVGDKIINTKNKEVTELIPKVKFWNQDKEGQPDPHHNGKCFLVNGDMGTIQEFEENKKMLVKFENPYRVVKLPLYNNDMILAYACTVHRYQGSECPICIIPVHSSISFMMDRPWIYTAISRASIACITVGEFSVIQNAIFKTNNLNRKTFLKERLLENNN